MNKKSFFQLFRFGIVGVLNTLIDFGVLNVLRWIFGVVSGWPIIVFNIIAVATAMTNSYFLNKYWVFHKKETGDRTKESILFILFTGIGMGINTVIVYYFATYLKPIFGIDSVLWLNVGKILATGVSLLWNFFWYKFVVFKISKENNQ